MQKVQDITVFEPADKVEEALVSWEKTLEDAELAQYTATWRLFNIASPVRAMELYIESQNDFVEKWLIGDGVGWGWTDTDTVVAVSSELADAVTNYAMLKVEDEIVIVKSVDRDANELTLYKRGYGNTDAAAHDDETEAKIIGYNYVHGVKDIESMVVDSSSRNYYVAKTTVPAVTFTTEDLTVLRKDYDEKGMEDYIDAQVEAQEKKLLKTMNKSVLFSSGEVATKTTPGSLVGLIEEAQLRGNRETTFGAIDSLEKIDNALDASAKKGGSANVILCGHKAYRAIQALAKDEPLVQQSISNRMDLVLGNSVRALETQVGTLVPIKDLNMPDDKVIILNSNDLYYAPFAGFEIPGADRTQAQESTRNDQKVTIDSIAQGGTFYENSNRNMTILEGVTY